MKHRPTGIMISFSLGLLAGLYATVSPIRNWLQLLWKKQKRHIIDQP